MIASALIAQYFGEVFDWDWNNAKPSNRQPERRDVDHPLADDPGEGMLLLLCSWTVARSANANPGAKGFTCGEAVLP